MFGIFSRKAKKKPEQPAANLAACAEPAPANQAVPSVIVKRSAVEQSADGGHLHLVFAVNAFVETMRDEGLYTLSELPPKAVHVDRADVYLAQVNNGGHSQFIHNCNVYGILGEVINHAATGLAGMGALQHLAVLKRMAAWADRYPDEVKEQTGFEGGRASLLDELDDLFYEADKASPMLALSARWITSWPELIVVDDADYAGAIRRLVMANPLREPRLLHRSIAKLVSQMIGWREVGVALAYAKALKSEVKMEFGMARMLEVEGEKQMVFQLRTSAKEPRLCVATETHAAIYEHIAPDDRLVPRPGESPLTAGTPRVGKRLARVEAPEIAMAIELAEEYHAPVAVDLLLRKAGFDPTDAIVSANSVIPGDGGAVVNWVVMASGHAFLLRSSPDGCMLWRGGQEESIAEAYQPELQEHFDRSAADQSV
ncbi:DUF4375 domain-containing protein [Mesorhizobium sp. M9A.F.Ca.ET.002.03.1.2]|uniref:DMP19 family protein n=1 Tax=Mesorhizobium sp. M9A.F.Ca.ET.002.03.1.2 TaxID=2493668 RepID=UPI000F756B6A|nr:DUF4375 domain-containing protein [Mesorhizobium sp. M9A.F.Ca.ET.002.03.1.2]AZN99052.1 DUF4375 domain-containing protein [Mesorhizobium sp. M9A.F.Ca.ET.002.03.1.2]